MLKLFCLAVAVVPICLAGCSRDRQAVGSSSEHHHLSISIDPRMELLSVVQILSDYGQRTGLITQYDLSYKKDVATYFAPYKDHPAVKSFRELSSYPYSFRFSTPPNTMLYLSDPPDLKVVSEIPKVIYSLSGGKAKLNEFLEELRDFAKASSFTSFFAEHQDFYSRILSGADAQLGGVDVVASLEDYFGTKQQSYNMIIVPLQAGNFGFTKDQGELYNVCGTDSLDNDTPYVKSVRNICWHEFGHWFSNPVVAEYLIDFLECMPLFDAIANKMFCMGYESFEGFIYEHVLRATNVRLTSIYLGTEQAKKAIRGHRSLGFVYVEALAHKLEQYEVQRDKYSTFDEFSRPVHRTYRHRTVSEVSPYGEEPALTRLAQSDPFSNSFVNLTKSTLRSNRTFPVQSSLWEPRNDSVLDSQDAIYRTASASDFRREYQPGESGTPRS